MVTYVETSAILSWLFGEKKSKEVEIQINRSKRIAASRLSIIEAQRGLKIGFASKRINESELIKAESTLIDLASDWLVIEINEEVLNRTTQMFPIEPVKTLDAIHLASALLCSKLSETVSVLSFDKKILENAEALGLKTI